jgi:hypothetical protein
VSAADYSPRSVEDAIRDTAERISRGVAVRAKAYRDFLEADHAHDLAEARAYVAAKDYPAHERKFRAVLATEGERRARDVADAVYRHAEAQWRALDAELRAWQSVGASVRAMYGVAGVGER